ncbi:MAG: lipase [Muribaculaceae bacterium]|nr:lipase [Muribaculaceae bacterium]
MITKSTSLLSLALSIGLLSCSQKQSETIIPANDPNINYMGRIYWDENGHGNFNYPGTSAILKFKGTGIRMETSPGSGKFVVEIDNQEPKTIMFTPTDSILTLAENLKDSIHNVRVTYAIEGFEFNPSFRSFSINGKPLTPDEKPELKIEFIGNSITCGYGIEANDPKTGFSYDTENHTKSYAYQTALALNADFNIVARSGIGIYRNYGGRKGGDTKTLPLEYDYTMIYNHDHLWDHTQFHPDIICINLGTNDTSENRYDISLYEQRYRDFLNYLRELHPNAKIVLLTGPMLNGKALTDVKHVLDKLSAEDSNTYRFDMSPQTGELGYGADYHPSASQTNRMTQELIPFLRSLNITQQN